MNGVLKGFRSVDATNYSTNVGNLTYEKSWRFSL